MRVGNQYDETIPPLACSSDYSNGKGGPCCKRHPSRLITSHTTPFIENTAGARMRPLAIPHRHESNPFSSVRVGQHVKQRSRHPRDTSDARWVWNKDQKAGPGHFTLD